MESGLQSCLQIFPSARLLETKAFYEGIGFRSVAYLDSEQPHVCLYRDSIEIILTKSRLDRVVPNREAHGYGYDAYCISTDQRSLFDELRLKGVKIVKGLELTDYRNREFIFEDNEGRWIAVGCKEGSTELLGLELGHVAFECRDIAAMEAFYASLLGLRRVREAKTSDGRDFFVLGRDNLRVEIFPERAARAAGFAHYAVSVDSLDNVIAMLQSRNVPIDRVIDYSTVDRAFKVCFITDPEGNTIEFMEGYADDAGKERAT